MAYGCLAAAQREIDDDLRVFWATANGTSRRLRPGQPLSGSRLWLQGLTSGLGVSLRCAAKRS